MAPLAPSWLRLRCDVSFEKFSTKDSQFFSTVKNMTSL